MAGTILYVDDAPELPEGFAHEARALGYRVAHTDDPHEGCRLAREGLPHLILLEVLLGSGDGWELLEEIRSWDGPAGRVPVVILTRGERSPKLYGRAVELEANDFLCKPALRHELLAAVLESSQRAKATSQVDPSQVDPRQGQAGDESESLLSGDLAEWPLPEVLLRLRRIGATGVLLVQHELENRGVQLRNGSPFAVASNRDVEPVEDFLVRTKQISGAEHEAVTERVEAGLGSAREILVGLGILGEAEVEAALDERAAEPLLEGFGWSSGAFRFLAGGRLPAGRALDLEQNPARLLFQGARRWSPAAVVRECLGRRVAHYVLKLEEPPCALQELGPNACDPEDLGLLLGDHTLAEVLDAGDIEERALYGLLIAGLVEAYAEPALTPGPLAPPEVEASAPVEPDAGMTDAARPELSTEEIARRMSYPQPSAQPPSAEALPGEDEGAADEGATRARDAESWFRKGESFLRGKRYDKAVEAFGMATHLDPNQGEYSAHLGWSLHLMRPKNALVRREALEHIAKGIKLSPERWQPLVFLGRVFKAAGELDNARKVFRRAIKIQPDCHAAHQEIRALNRPAESQSFMQRLLAWRPPASRSRS